MTVYFASVVSLSFLFSIAATCPLWYYYHNTSQHCWCGCELSCINDSRVEIREGHCATSAKIEDYYYIGSCHLRHTVNNTNRMLSEMPRNPELLNSVMCEHYNRKGLLCGECIEGFGPAIYSYDPKCVSCSQMSTGSALVLYLLLELVPITVFYLLILIFRFNVMYGPMLCYILFCQYLTHYSETSVINMTYSHHKLLQIGLVLCRFWTLHWILKSLVTPFCISKSMTNIHIQLLSLVSVIHPIFLVCVTCLLMELHSRNNFLVVFLWKPFAFILKKIKVNPATSDSVVHAFATFIFLTNSTILWFSVTISYSNTIKRHDCSQYRSTLAVDPTVEWRSKTHILYIIIAAIPVIFLSFIPWLLLAIYPTRIYKWLSNFISARKRLVIMIFAEAQHSFLKDGLNGTRDYRAFAGLFFPFNVLLCWINTLISQNIGYPSEVSAVIFLLLYVFLISWARPFKSQLLHVSFIFHLSLGVIICMLKYMWSYSQSTISTYTLEISYVFIYIIPHIFIFICLGYKLTQYSRTYFHFCFSYFQHFSQVVLHLRSVVDGYQQLD